MIRIKAVMTLYDRNWCKVMHSLRSGNAIYVSMTSIIFGSDNGSSPAWHQAITRTNVHLFSTGSFELNSSDIWINFRWFRLWKCSLQNVNDFVPISMCQEDWQSAVTVNIVENITNTHVLYGTYTLKVMYC